jgi:cytochrome P450
MLFLSGLPHQIFNRKGFAARETIVSAFTKFFADKKDEQASQLVKNRAEVLRRYGIPDNDIARLETVNGFGILLNLLPTAYWTIWHIFSDSVLLDAIREEARAALGSDSSLKGKSSLDATQQFPLLNSVMHEVLRYNTTGAAVRRVMKDHLLNGQFLLKGGNYCLVPNKGIHFNTDQWGANARSFQPDRFLNGKTNRESFRGFGGGINACPGKAFASRLILTIVAAMVLRFDIEPCTESGKLEHPGHDESSMAIVVARPARKYRVNFVQRDQR